MIISSPKTNWRFMIDNPNISNTVYVWPTASVIGLVSIGQNVLIGPGASIRGDEGAEIYIGNNSNVQDNVIMHGLKNGIIEVEGKLYSIYIGEEVSCAHGCIIHGPTYIGRNTFVGFGSIIHNSTIGENCFIGHGSRIIGVDIPNGTHISIGEVVQSEEDVKQLLTVSDENLRFNRSVVQTNVELVTGYKRSEETLMGRKIREFILLLEQWGSENFSNSQVI